MIPRNYEQAAKLLCQRKQVMIHDDLILKRVRGGISLVFRRLAIVKYLERYLCLEIRGGTRRRPVIPEVVEHIRQALPPGYSILYVDGEMQVTRPDGYQYICTAAAIPIEVENA